MLTKEQATCITVMTGCLMLDPPHFLEAIGEKLQRKVLPEEFTPTFQEELKKLYYDEFVELCWEPPHGGLILPSA